VLTRIFKYIADQHENRRLGVKQSAYGERAVTLSPLITGFALGALCLLQGPSWFADWTATILAWCWSLGGSLLTVSWTVATEGLRTGMDVALRTPWYATEPGVVSSCARLGDLAMYGFACRAACRYLYWSDASWRHIGWAGLAHCRWTGWARCLIWWTLIMCYPSQACGLALATTLQLGAFALCATRGPSEVGEDAKPAILLLGCSHEPELGTVSREPLRVYRPASHLRWFHELCVMAGYLEEGGCIGVSSAKEMLMAVLLRFCWTARGSFQLVRKELHIEEILRPGLSSCTINHILSVLQWPMQYVLLPALLVKDQILTFCFNLGGTLSQTMLRELRYGFGALGQLPGVGTLMLRGQILAVGLLHHFEGYGLILPDTLSVLRGLLGMSPVGILFLAGNGWDALALIAVVNLLNRFEIRPRVSLFLTSLLPEPGLQPDIGSVPGVAAVDPLRDYRVRFERSCTAMLLLASPFVAGLWVLNGTWFLCVQLLLFYLPDCSVLFTSWQQEIIRSDYRAEGRRAAKGRPLFPINRIRILQITESRTPLKPDHVAILKYGTRGDHNPLNYICKVLRRFGLEVDMFSHGTPETGTDHLHQLERGNPAAALIGTRQLRQITSRVAPDYGAVLTPVFAQAVGLNANSCSFADFRSNLLPNIDWPWADLWGPIVNMNFGPNYHLGSTASSWPYSTDGSNPLTFSGRYMGPAEMAAAARTLALLPVESLIRRQALDLMTTWAADMRLSWEDRQAARRHLGERFALVATGSATILDWTQIPAGTDWHNSCRTDQIPPGAIIRDEQDHARLFRHYDTVYCHGGAGTARTAIASGAEVVVLSSLIDRNSRGSGAATAHGLYRVNDATVLAQLGWQNPRLGFKILEALVHAKEAFMLEDVLWSVLCDVSVVRMVKASCLWLTTFGMVMRLCWFGLTAGGCLNCFAVSTGPAHPSGLIMPLISLILSLGSPLWIDTRFLTLGASAIWFGPDWFSWTVQGALLCLSVLYPSAVSVFESIFIAYTEVPPLETTPQVCTIEYYHTRQGMGWFALTSGERRHHIIGTRELMIPGPRLVKPRGVWFLPLNQELFTRTGQRPVSSLLVSRVTLNIDGSDLNLQLVPEGIVGQSTTARDYQFLALRIVAAQGFCVSAPIVCWMLRQLYITGHLRSCLTGPYLSVISPSRSGGAESEDDLGHLVRESGPCNPGGRQRGLNSDSQVSSIQQWGNFRYCDLCLARERGDSPQILFLMLELLAIAEEKFSTLIARLRCDDRLSKHLAVLTNPLEDPIPTESTPRLESLQVLHNLVLAAGLGGIAVENPTFELALFLRGFGVPLVREEAICLAQRNSGGDEGFEEYIITLARQKLSAHEGCRARFTRAQANALDPIQRKRIVIQSWVLSLLEITGDAADRTASLMLATWGTVGLLLYSLILTPVGSTRWFETFPGAIAAILSSIYGSELVNRKRRREILEAHIAWRLTRTTRTFWEGATSSEVAIRVNNALLQASNSSPLSTRAVLPILPAIPDILLCASSPALLAKLNQLLVRQGAAIKLAGTYSRANRAIKDWLTTRGFQVHTEALHVQGKLWLFHTISRDTLDPVGLPQPEHWLMDREGQAWWKDTAANDPDTLRTQAALSTVGHTDPPSLSIQPAWESSFSLLYHNDRPLVLCNVLDSLSSQISFRHPLDADPGTAQEGAPWWLRMNNIRRPLFPPGESPVFLIEGVVTRRDMSNQVSPKDIWIGRLPNSRRFSFYGVLSWPMIDTALANLESEHAEDLTRERRDELQAMEELIVCEVDSAGHQVQNCPICSVINRIAHIADTAIFVLFEGRWGVHSRFFNPLGLYLSVQHHSFTFDPSLHQLEIAEYTVPDTGNDVFPSSP